MKRLAVLAVALAGLLVGQVSADAPKAPTPTTQATLVDIESVLTLPVPSGQPIRVYTQDNQTVLGRQFRVALIVGSSMQPVLNDGQFALYEPAVAADVRAGDLLLFQRLTCPLDGPYRGYVIHQVTKVTTAPSWFAATRGINNKMVDLCVVEAGDVAGVIRLAAFAPLGL